MNGKVIAAGVVVAVVMGWPMLSEPDGISMESSNTALSILAVLAGVGYQAWRNRD